MSAISYTCLYDYGVYVNKRLISFVIESPPKMAI